MEKTTVKKIMIEVFGTDDAEQILNAIPFDEDGCREIKVPAKGVRLYETQNRRHFCRIGLSVKRVGALMQSVAVKAW